MTEGTQYYYNLTNGTVEEGHQSPGTELMGPYPTREEAARALQTAAERNSSWDEENAEWESYGSEGSRSDGPR